MSQSEHDEDFESAGDMLINGLEVAQSVPKYRQEPIIGVKFRGKTTPACITVDAVDAMDVHDALRELSQNTLDAAVECNGAVLGEREPSYDKLRFSMKTNDNTSITIIHSDAYRFAEIRAESECKRPAPIPLNMRHIPGEKIGEIRYGKITFASHGSALPSEHHLVYRGATSKRGKRNQIGRHGEGFINAVTVLLRNGAGVRVIAAVREAPKEGREQYSVRDIRYYLTENGSVEYVQKRAKAQVYQRVHVIVQVTFPIADNDCLRDFQGYSLENYLVPLPLIRAQTSEEDAGSIIFEPSERGSIYVWHFHITAYVEANLRWGYDLFLKRVNRDRDDIPWKTLVREVARCWSAEIERDDRRCATFLQFLTDSQQCSERYAEVQAVEHLSDAAKKALAEKWRSNHTDCVAALEKHAGDARFANIWSASEPLLELLKHTEKPITRSRVLKAAREQPQQALPEAPTPLEQRARTLVQWAAEKCATIARIEPAYWALPLHFMEVETPRKDEPNVYIRINLNSDAWGGSSPFIFGDMESDRVSRARLLHTLLCEWLPHAARLLSMPWSAHPLLEEMMRQADENAVTESEEDEGVVTAEEEPLPIVIEDESLLVAEEDDAIEEPTQSSAQKRPPPLLVRIPRPPAKRIRNGFDEEYVNVRLSVRSLLENEHFMRSLRDSVRGP